MCRLKWIFRWCYRGPRIVSVRLAGLSYINPDGSLTMATVQLTIGKSYTAPLIFTDATGASGVGPIGSVSSNDPAIVPSLSADGQTLNVSVIAKVADPPDGASITWTDPAGTIADTVLVSVTDQAVTPPPFVATSVALGALVEAAAAP